MSLAARLDKVAAALGGRGEPGILIACAADDDTWRTADGEAVDLTALDPALTVLLYRQVPAGSRPATAPHTEPT